MVLNSHHLFIIIEKYDIKRKHSEKCVPHLLLKNWTKSMTNISEVNLYFFFFSLIDDANLTQNFLIQCDK